ncbi:MAG: hypothetical protein WCL11_25455 [Verrucomicrobiota bacterium]
MKMAIDHPPTTRLRNVLVWLGMLLIFAVLPVAIAVYVVYWASAPATPDRTPINVESPMWKRD